MTTAARQRAAAFVTPEDQRLVDAFLRDGCIVAPAEDVAALDRIREATARSAASALGLPPPADPGAFLDAIADRVDARGVNELRLSVIHALLREPWFRAAYFACGRTLVERIVGNELAMQREIGLSIQLPHDASSLLPLHDDAWSEDSPYEVVLWIPLVDCHRTKSMFLLPPEADARWRARLDGFERRGGVDAFFDELRDDLRWLDVPYGNVVVFTHTLMHGNRVNVEPTTRWSMNVRFKGLFTPYSDKRLGEFFEPITIRPASRIGMRYALPGRFHE